LFRALLCLASGFHFLTSRRLAAKRRIENPSAVSTKKSWLQERRKAVRTEAQFLCVLVCCCFRFVVSRAIGSAEALMAKAADLGQTWIKGVAAARAKMILRERPT